MDRHPIFDQAHMMVVLPCVAGRQEEESVPRDPTHAVHDLIQRCPAKNLHFRYLWSVEEDWHIALKCAS
ncbi:hypothetical protein [Nostoc sp. FACHB-888]|uniref:hypothetical protein n=1 Tax=Nostoc sp. FACHB-888 TaxID=2692842 RepID=UPI0016836D4F|nr:hypothetical protein [Nostoc sp. FACHB-888]MBD2249070.1 hypothetical protein [Nostoc sp. FACHB-888]